MAMIKCGECGNAVSDKATACQKCGAPISAKAVTHVVHRRAGGKWEAAGFVLIMIGLITMMAGSGWGGALLGAGFVVFLVGRFK